MDRKRTPRHDALARYVRVELREELQAWAALLREEWPWFALAALALALLVAVARPIPVGKVHLAAGHEDSSDWMVGQRLAALFAQRGFKLELVRTAGSTRSLRDLVDRNSEVNAALLQGGLARKEDFPDLVSLGSIQYTPLWLFHRGEALAADDPFEALADRRVSIGPAGSGTQHLVRQIEALRGVRLGRAGAVLELGHAESARALAAGDIDAMFVVDSIHSPVVRGLFTAPGVQLFDFALAPAYVRNIAYLDVVTVPRGSLDPKAVRPPRDVRMVSTTTALLVSEDTHPAIQQLFLMAADDISNGRDQFFARSEAFPAYFDHAMPLSPVARRYYETGPPPLAHHAPLWLASFIDRAWLLALGLAAIALPLWRLLPSYRQKRSEIYLAEVYDSLHAIDREIGAARDAPALAALASRLDGLDGEVAGAWIATDELADYYTLREAIALVRDEVRARAAALAAPHPGAHP